MDRLDDEAILDELKGLVPRTLVYHYRERGREVWGLSKAGIDEACALLAKQGHVIRELRLSYEVNNERKEAYFRVLAGRFAVLPDGREVRLDTAWGAKRQPLANGLGVPNPHWYEQGAMKAARNARARLVGSELKAKIIAQAKETNRVRRVAPDRPRRASAAQLHQIRELLATVKLKDGIRERLLARLESSRFTADQAERAVAYLKGVADRHGDAETNPSAEPDSTAQVTVKRPGFAGGSNS